MDFLVKKFQWFFLIVVIGTSIHVINDFELNETPMVGDQQAFVLQALSIPNDFDLTFDQSDEQHWIGLNWGDKHAGFFGSVRNSVSIL